MTVIDKHLKWKPDTNFPDNLEVHFSYTVHYDIFLLIPGYTTYKESVKSTHTAHFHTMSPITCI